jgi:hypothetical protein
VEYSKYVTNNVKDGYKEEARQKLIEILRQL